MPVVHDLSCWPAVLLAGLLLAALVADVRKDLSRLVMGRNVVLFAICAWYLLEAIMLPEALRSHPQEEYTLGVLYVGLAAAGFLLGYHLTPGCTLFGNLAETITFFDDEKWLWRLVVIGAVVGFTPVIYFTGSEIGEMLVGILGMRATWGGVLGRDRYGDARAAFLMVEMFVGGVAPFAVILLFSRGQTIVQRLFLALVILWPLLCAYGSGTRSSMIVSFGSVAALFYWKAAPALRKKMIIAGLVCLPFFYGLMAALVVSRGSGTFDYEDRDKAQYVGNEMFRELLFISAAVPAKAEHQWGYSYYVQLVNPIPRFLWPDKPTLDTGIWMAQMYGEVNKYGEAKLTISPGLIGEMYLNFGVVGIFLLSLFGGWLVKGWDQIPKLYGRSLTALMFYSGGLFVLFIMGRSFTMGMFYGLLSLAGLAWLIRWLNPRAVAASRTPEPIP